MDDFELDSPDFLPLEYWDSKPAHHNVKLSAEVEPFIPQKKNLDAFVLPMALPNANGNVSGVEPTPIPSYLITCYPFVQENQSNRQFPLYNNDIRWQQPSPSPTGPYLAYPIISAQPPVSTEYTYYQLMPAPCAQVMGFYHPFPTPYSSTFQAANTVNAITTECTERPHQQGQAFPLSSHRSRNGNRGPVVPKPQLLHQHIKNKRPQVKNVATQKETSSAGPDSRSKIVLLVDASQQTDFPSDIANKSLSESTAAMLWKAKGRRRRASHPAAESSSEQGASEADIDSDSGYCSPKHNNQPAAGALRNADSATMNHAESSGCTGGVNWPKVTCQATQKRPWMEKHPVFSRGGRQTEQRNNSQAGFRCRGHSTSSERRQNLQKRQDTKHLNSTQSHRSDLNSESLYFEDEDGFQELSENGNSKDENIQQKLPSKVLDDLPENSPINIVQTPIPITTSVPKRAKSQKKKALAAALATAQEYSEISMEQKKLQEALSKAAGKKSKSPVQLDLGDMLAALEKQQQAMRARQATNTRPLAHPVAAAAAAFHTKDSVNRKPLTKSQPCLTSCNSLDIISSKAKKGKEKEIAKLKRPTALKKVILKEREEKKGRLTVEHSVLGAEEPTETHLDLTNDLPQETVSQEDTGLSMPSDASLSPASQNSPYCMTPVSQGSPASSGIGSPMASSTITKIHSKRFREYCNQVLSKEIDECVTLLLQELVSFQERIYQKDPVRAKARRRLVMGLREVTKHMKLNKIKCVIISPNCEKIQSKGGLDEALYNVIAMAREQEIPFVFALGRKALGRCVNKLVPVSVVGIFNYFGAESLFNRLVELTEEARKAYKDMVAATEQEQAEEALKSVKTVPHHMGHSRNPSAASAISFCSVISEPISEVNEKEYETNWRSMVETSDGLETSENEKELPCKQGPSEKPSKLTLDTTFVSKQPPLAAGSTTSAPGQGKPVSDKDDLKPDDLEWASQQSTETGSLDGSCRDLLNSSITSTTSTLVPGMLEEEEDEEEEEEEDYTHEPISVEVQLNSRIESWVSETQRTMETLQLGKALPGPEEDSAEQSGEESAEAPEGLESGVDSEHCTPDQQLKPSNSVNRELSEANSAPPNL
ncbi:Secisbp2l [Phodopus roborovskii]|uniref:Secisbp2l protein n=1 Tax=Phodopus roborovskii TaxID=109678 RepID=A0AAU9Z5E5_PHORO|nr:Secisbp2l [Phodopus roborovskii]